MYAICDRRKHDGGSLDAGCDAVCNITQRMVGSTDPLITATTNKLAYPYMHVDYTLQRMETKLHLTVDTVHQLLNERT
jgi:hypothetical protein